MRKLLEILFQRHTNQRLAERETGFSSEGHADAPRPWIAVDLDGTLAEYAGWNGINNIGKPIPLMRERVEAWIEAGYTVKIFTARASVPGGLLPVRKWLERHRFPPLEVTNQKDFHMIELWDDRAVQVVTNTGRPIVRASVTGKPLSPLRSKEVLSATVEVAPRDKKHRESSLLEQRNECQNAAGTPSPDVALTHPAAERSKLKTRQIT